MSSLFITGSTGFIGSHLLRTISFQGYDKIYCLVRSKQDRKVFPDICELVTGDISRPAAYAAILEKCKTVVHLAAVTGKAPKEEYFGINTEGTRVLIRQCEQKSVENFLYISTIAIKYQSRKHYYYAESKESAEEAVKKSSLHYTILRPTIVLGKESALWKKLSMLVTRRIIFVPGTGQAIIQPVDVEDLCQCIQSILQAQRFCGEILEIGGPDKLTLENFLEKVHAHLFGGKYFVLRIPIKPFLQLLSFVEKLVPSLPVTTGQFSAFYNDGTADSVIPDALCGSKMKGINLILKELTTHE